MSRSTTLGSPFPASIAFEVTRPEDLAGFELFPEEAVALSPKTIAKRRLHFRLGRAAARGALGKLGIEPQPLHRAEDGRPLWPAGIVGAITHTDVGRDLNVAAAAVARSGEYCGVGLDLEALSRTVSPEVARRVCSDDELRWVQDQDANQRSLMIFAAKEAIFKALYPLEQIFLGFADAELTWDDAAAGFHATLHRRAAVGFPAGARFEVGCRIVNGMVMAYTHLPRELPESLEEEQR